MRTVAPAAGIAWMFACVLAASPGVANDLSASAPVAQLAAGIARTMAATTPPNAVMEQRFSAHDNVVEWRTLFRASTDYQKGAANRRNTETALTRFMCQPSRLVYIRRGVVFREVYSGPDAGESFEFVIDERACDALPKVAPADVATLASLAAEVAQQLGSQSQPQTHPAGLRIESPLAHGGVVDMVNVVLAPAFADYFKMKSAQIRGATQGWLCAKFGDAIRRGVKVHVIYKLEEGPPLFEFVADSSVC